MQPNRVHLPGRRVETISCKFFPQSFSRRTLSHSSERKLHCNRVPPHSGSSWVSTAELVQWKTRDRPVCHFTGPGRCDVFPPAETDTVSLELDPLKKPGSHRHLLLSCATAGAAFREQEARDYSGARLFKLGLTRDFWQAMGGSSATRKQSVAQRTVCERPANCSL